MPGTDRIKKRLESIEKLPTLPGVIEKLESAVRDEDSDAGRIAGIIKDDPAIMARVMKVVNSVFYSGVSEPPGIRSAVVRLGFRTVSNIAMSAAVFSTFPPGKGRVFDRRGFWRHSICTGIAAECLHEKLPVFSELGIAREELQIAGLVHDIGKIIFEQFFHEQFVRALEISGSRGIPLSSAECGVIGADHCAAGAWLGRKWNLPPGILAVIRWHHSPNNADPRYQSLVSACCLADLVVNAAGIGESGNSCNGLEQKIEHEFDLEEKFLVKLIDLIHQKAENSLLLELLDA